MEAFSSPAAGRRVRDSMLKGLQKLKQTVTLTPSSPAPPASEEHESREEVVITDAALIEVINSYCGFEAGVRNLRKCIDRVFRKIVSKLELKKIAAVKEKGIQ